MDKNQENKNVSSVSNGVENKQIKKRKLQGTVVSDKMNKTAVVEVVHFRKHPKYLKYYKISTRLKAHDENKDYKTGDQVIIEETRPLSKTKRWRIVEKIKAQVHPPQTAPVNQ